MDKAGQKKAIQFVSCRVPFFFSASFFSLLTFAFRYGLIVANIAQAVFIYKANVFANEQAVCWAVLFSLRQLFSSLIDHFFFSVFFLSPRQLYVNLGVHALFVVLASYAAYGGSKEIKVKVK